MPKCSGTNISGPKKGQPCNTELVPIGEPVPIKDEDIKTTGSMCPNHNCDKFSDVTQQHKLNA